MCSWQRPSKESYRVLVVLGGDRVEKLLLLLKLLRSFGQGQVNRKENEVNVYCEFVSVVTRVYAVGQTKRLSRQESESHMQVL